MVNGTLTIGVTPLACRLINTRERQRFASVANPTHGVICVSRSGRALMRKRSDATPGSFAAIHFGVSGNMLLHGKAVPMALR